MGWAPTRAAARQMVNHGHVRVNEQKMSIPSYQVMVDEVLVLDETATKIPAVAELLKEEPAALPAWLKRKGPSGKIVRLPVREDVKESIDEQLIVEYYSR